VQLYDQDTNMHPCIGKWSELQEAQAKMATELIGGRMCLHNPVPAYAPLCQAAGIVFNWLSSTARHCALDKGWQLCCVDCRLELELPAVHHLG
jgi:hypothetical protein